MTYEELKRKFIEVNPNMIGFPIGTWVYAATNNRDKEFPKEDWINPHKDGTIHSVKDYPELAEAKPEWVINDEIYIPNTSGRFLRGTGSLAGEKPDTLQGFTSDIKLNDTSNGNNYPFKITPNCSAWISLNIKSHGKNVYQGVGKGEAYALDEIRVLDQTIHTNTWNETEYRHVTFNSIPLSNEVRPNSLVAELYLCAGKNKAIENFYKLMYPVGSVYITTVDPLDKVASKQQFSDPRYNPLSYGVWELIPQPGGSLIQVNRDDPEMAYAKMKGGNKYISLTEEELPKHSHDTTSYTYQYPNISNNQPLSGKRVHNVVERKNKTHTSGKGKKFSIQNKFYTVCFYVRIA